MLENHCTLKLQNSLVGCSRIGLSFVHRDCFRLRGAFSGFCRGRGALVEGCSVCVGTLLRQGVSEPEFCYDLVCGFGGVVGESDFSEQFGELNGRYGRVGCGLDVVRLAACLVVGPVVVGGCASLFGCAAAVRASISVAASSWGFGSASLAWPAVVQLLVFICSGMQWSWPWVLVFVCCGD